MNLLFPIFVGGAVAGLLACSGMIVAAHFDLDNPFQGCLAMALAGVFVAVAGVGAYAIGVIVLSLLDKLGGLL